MLRVQDKLQQLLLPAVEGLGYELVGIEYVAQGKHSVLRIYIDSDEGITVDDCSRVSHQVNGVLEVEDPIPGQFTLEISSPGLDRPLFTAEHFARFVGSTVKLRLYHPVEGRRKVKGIIDRVEDEIVYIKDMDEEQLYSLEMDNIEKANLVPEF